MAITWNDINNGESGLSVRTKINDLGGGLANFMNAVDSRILTLDNALLNTWVSDTSNYPFLYKGTIQWAGITEDYLPQVIFTPEMASSGLLSTFAISGEDCVYVYSMDNTISTTVNLIAVGVNFNEPTA